MTYSNKLRLTFSILATALTLIVGALFIGEIANVYYGGLSAGVEHIYNPDALRQNLIAPFVALFLWIAVEIAAYVAFEIYPYSSPSKVRPDPARTLARVERRMPAHGSSFEFIKAREGIKQCRASRAAVWAAALAICVAGGIYALVFLLDGAHFKPENMHENAMDLVRHVISWTAASIIALMAAGDLELYFVKREANFAKIAIKTGDRDTIPVPRREQKLSRKARLVALWSVRAAVGVIAVSFIIVGAINGGANDVLVKAINICTECIGLG